MNDLSFIKVTVVPETTQGTRLMDLEILIPVTGIIAVRKKIGIEYEILLNTKFQQQIEAHFFGKETRIKEVKAKIKDESIFW